MILESTYYAARIRFAEIPKKKLILYVFPHKFATTRGENVQFDLLCDCFRETPSRTTMKLLKAYHHYNNH